MNMRKLRLILIFGFIAVCSALYTNCDSFDSSGVPRVEQGQKSGFPNLAHNGGGHLGKLTYLNTSLNNQCGTDPVRSLVFEGSDVQAFTHQCQAPVESAAVDPNRLLLLAYDPYFVVYDERIYAYEDLLKKDPNQRMAFDLFCYNSDYVDPSLGTKGLDFALKIVKNLYNGYATTQKMGYLIYGRENSEPLMLTEWGTTKDADASGVKPFYPDSRSYEVRIEKRSSPARTKANILIKSTGAQVPLDCYIKPVFENAQ